MISRGVIVKCNAGQFIIPYKKIGEEGTSKILFYNVNKKGQETLIKEFETIVGDDPVEITVDLRGVEILKIHYDRESSKRGAFYNVTLAVIQ